MLGPTIRTARVMLGLSQREVAKRLGKSQVWLHQIEHDKYKPSYTALQGLVDVLHLTPADVLPCAAYESATPP